MWAMQILKKHIVKEVKQKQARETHKKEILILLVGIFLGIGLASVI